MSMEYKKEQQATRNALKPKLIKYNSRFKRANRRRRDIDRTMTKKGYAFGIKIGGRTYNVLHHIAKRFGDPDEQPVSDYVYKPKVHSEVDLSKARRQRNRQREYAKA